MNDDNDGEDKMNFLDPHVQLPVDRMAGSVCQPNSMNKCFRIDSSDLTGDSDLGKLLLCCLLRG